MKLREITYNGLTLTLSNWAAKTNQPRDRIAYRDSAGWPPGQALGYERRIQPKIQRKPAVRNPKRYEHDGKNLTLKEWAAELDIPVKTIYNRRRQGLPLEMVFAKRRAASMGPIAEQPLTLMPVELLTLDHVRIGKLAKKIRRSIGMTQQQAARLMHFSRWDYFERGERPWTRELIDKFNAMIAKAISKQ